MAFTGKAHTYT